MYIDKNGGALPAMWQSPPGCNFNSIFAAKEDALKAMKSEAYYKEYFYVDEQVP